MTLKNKTIDDPHNKHNTSDYWETFRGYISSSKGGWIAGQDAYSHGYPILNTLLGNITYMQMHILNATGRLVDKALADWFEGHFICLSWPDSRIWCNHIAALSGTLKSSVVASLSAGVLGADSIMYGGSKTSLKGMQTIQQALRDYEAGKSIATIISQYKTMNSKPTIMGFDRPIGGADERIQPTEQLTTQLGFKIGKHLSLAYKINDYLKQHYNMGGMNIGGYAYAFLSDQKISAQELYQIRAFIVVSGVIACHIDSASKPAESFLPLHCNDINYTGAQPRQLPDKI